MFSQINTSKDIIVFVIIGKDSYDKRHGLFFNLYQNVCYLWNFTFQEFTVDQNMSKMQNNDEKLEQLLLP